MAIYRGPGGPGDATADQANTAQLALTYANQSAASASSAATSATNASNSASAASSSASTASTAATNAQTAETNAETAETNAEAAQTAAEAARDASINLATNFTATATTLSPGSSATASYNSGTYTLTLGIPTGATGSTGATGAQGPEGLNWLGAYSGGTSYVIDDAVSYNGSSYICKLASTGNLPTNTTYWDIFAQQGAPGAGTGDIVGPSSATDNTIARFDGTTGKVIQNSVVTVADTTGDISGVGQLNATTVDATNIEVTNIKAKDGTANISIADTTGIATFSKATVIETTDNTNAALRITQLGTGNALLVEDSANPDASPFVIDASGRVIAGYTQNIDSSQIQTFNGSQTNFRWNAASTGPTTAFKKSRSATVGSYSIVGASDVLGNLVWSGDDGITFIPAASIIGTVDGTPGASDMPGRLLFSTTADGASSPTERMRITSAGNVGIATTAPAAKLHSAGNTILSNVDMLNASYDSVSFSVAGEETVPTGLFFSPDGTRMYVTGQTGDDVNQYSLSTPWVVSSATYVTNFSISGQETAPNGIFFRADGLKMYIVGSTNDTVYQYALTIPWAISTASYESISFSVASQEINPSSIFFKPNGLTMYVVGNTGDAVSQYTLSTAWNVSTATFTQSFSVSAQETVPTDLFFTGDGSRMFVMGQSGDDVNVYNLTTPWDISTSAFVGVFSVSGQDNAPNGIYVKPDGTKFYMVGTTNDTVYQYTIPSIEINLTGTTNINGGATVAQDLTVDGIVQVSAGSATVPGIAPSTDTNTGIFFPAADTIAFAEGGVESVRITSAGEVLIGTTTAASTQGGNLQVITAAAIRRNVAGTGGGALRFEKSRSATDGGYTIVQNDDNLGEVQFYGADGVDYAVAATIKGIVNGTPGSNDMPGALVFSTTADGSASVTERARIDSSGNLLVGQTTVDSATAGASLRSTGQIVATASAIAPLYVNRLTSDGDLVQLAQASTVEGTISVSGTTVSYNGGHLSRWAQMPGTKDDTLVKGTVMSNLDEMNVYIAPTTYWTEEDELPEGVNVGDVKVETHQVDNEQLNKVKVSDVEGDVNVAGVFVNWTYDDAHQVDEINMAMTGDMIIRVAQGVVVQKGDLLMSAGDGTAKPQGDDIVRSKTVAKVTSNHVTCTYADGSYCVPCVLMAC